MRKGAVRVMVARNTSHHDHVDLPMPIPSLGPRNAVRRFFNERRRHAYPRLITFTAIATSIILVVFLWISAGGSDRHYAGDFVVYWSASELALDGRAEAVYDYASLYAVEVAVFPDHGLLPWHYPPHYLLFTAPLGLLSFEFALAGWLVITLGLYLSVLFRTTTSARHVMLLVALPAIFINAIWGQNGFLVAALAGLSLALLPRRPAWSGVALGLLTFKPHLVPVLGVALLAGRQWKALAVACLAGIGLFLATSVAFGPGIWATYLRDLDEASEYLRHSDAATKMPTVSGALQLAGLPPTMALAVQVPVSLAVLGLVAAMWARPTPASVRNPATLVGMVLASPYAFVYDLPVVALGLAWLLDDRGRHPFGRWEVTIICAAVMAPIGAWMFAAMTSVQLGPLVLMLLFGLCVRRAGVVPAVAMAKTAETALRQEANPPREAGTVGR